ncbi:MAG: AAA family ATPase [Bacillota bacterium]
MPADERRPHRTEDILQWIELGHISAPVALSYLTAGEDDFAPDRPPRQRPVEAPPRERAPARPAATLRERVLAGRAGAAEEEDPRDPLEELEELIGLEKIKQTVREVTAFAEIQRLRNRLQLTAEPTVLHMVFRGNPGTGKTTVARILGRILGQAGVLRKGHLLEAERADLVGEYIGHTAQKTRAKIAEAMDGVLFVDEAYSLARGGEKDFGKEAIDTMVKAMEDHKDRFVLILAGYSDEMDWFLEQNPGLRSRFAIHLEFPDYSPEQLLAICNLMLRDRQYRLSPEAEERLVGLLRRGRASRRGNARQVRNLLERAMRRQAVRLVEQTIITREDLITLTEREFEEIQP